MERALNCLDRPFRVEHLPPGTRLYRLSWRGRNPPQAWFYLERDQVATMIMFKVAARQMKTETVSDFRVDTYEVTHKRCNSLFSTMSTTRDN
jgi:hypothetical protein